MDTDTRNRLAAGLESLTPKECEVLDLIARGQTNAEIAETLHITFPTAKTHVSAILSKLGVESRDEAAHLARAQRPSRLQSKLRAFGLGSLALKLAGAATLVACAGLGVTAFALTRDTPPGNTLTVPLSDLQPGQPRLYRPAILGDTPWGDPYGVWVVLQQDGTVDAFFDRDPWSYCTTNWLPDLPTEGYIVNSSGTHPASATIGGVAIPLEIGTFKVGCSGWNFNIHGEFRFGAAPRGLDSFPVGIKGDQAVVRFDEVHLGQCALTNTHPSDCSQPGAPEVRATVPPPSQPTYGFPKP